MPGFEVLKTFQAPDDGRAVLLDSSRVAVVSTSGDLLSVDIAGVYSNASDHIERHLGATAVTAIPYVDDGVLFVATQTCAVAHVPDPTDDLVEPCEAGGGLQILSLAAGADEFVSVPGPPTQTNLAGFSAPDGRLVVESAGDVVWTSPGANSAEGWRQIDLHGSTVRCATGRHLVADVPSTAAASATTLPTPGVERTGAIRLLDLDNPGSAWQTLAVEVSPTSVSCSSSGALVAGNNVRGNSLNLVQLAEPSMTATSVTSIGRGTALRSGPLGQHEAAMFATYSESLLRARVVDPVRGVLADQEVPAASVDDSERELLNQASFFAPGSGRILSVVALKNAWAVAEVAR